MLLRIYYLQNLFEVNTIISNTSFHDNQGTLSASAVIISVASIRSRTMFDSCLLSDSNGMAFTFNTAYGLRLRGGITYFYFKLRNVPGINSTFTTNMTSNIVNALDVLKCNFIKIGGTLGAAFHIEKISSDPVSLVIRIEDCNFIGNIANAGSAVYAIDSRFGASTSTGRLTLNINAENNIVSPSATLQYDSSNYITGVFSELQQSL